MLNQHQTVNNYIAKYNRQLPLVEYLYPYIEGKQEVKIADVGSGPISIIGQQHENIKVWVYPSDNQDFSQFWTDHQAVPLFPIEYQNMEDTTYPNDYFDLVHCSNALDHTPDALKAVREMIRITKPGGWVYIDCNLDQRQTGHKHYWDAKEDGTLTNGSSYIDLKSLGFSIEYIQNPGERRYSKIIATLHK